MYAFQAYFKGKKRNENASVDLGVLVDGRRPQEGREVEKGKDRR